MRPISLLELVLTTDAAGAGTVDSTAPVCGEIVSVRVPNAGTTIMGGGGTADFTITRLRDGGTILAAANQTAPWELNPRLPAHTTSAGTTAYAVGVGPVTTGGPPVDGYIRVVMSGGTPSAGKSGTVYLYVKGAVG